MAEKPKPKGPRKLHALSTRRKKPTDRLRHVRFIPDGNTVIVQDMDSGFLMKLRAPVEGSVPSDVVGFLPVED